MSKYIDQTILLAYQHDGAAEEERFATQFGLRAAIQVDTARLPWLSPELRSYLNKVQGRDVRIPAIKKGSISAVTVLSYELPLNLPETDYMVFILKILKINMFLLIKLNETELQSVMKHWYLLLKHL